MNDIPLATPEKRKSRPMRMVSVDMGYGAAEWWESVLFINERESQSLFGAEKTLELLVETTARERAWVDFWDEILPNDANSYCAHKQLGYTDDMTTNQPTIAQRKSALEIKLAQVCGVEVEITVRGLKKFTISTDGDTVEQLKAAYLFLNAAGSVVSWEASYDEECEATFAYFTLA